MTCVSARARACVCIPLQPSPPNIFVNPHLFVDSIQTKMPFWKMCSSFVGLFGQNIRPFWVNMRLFLIETYIFDRNVYVQTKTLCWKLFIAFVGVLNAYGSGRRGWEGVRVHIGTHWAERVGRAPPGGGLGRGFGFVPGYTTHFGKGPGQH